MINKILKTINDNNLINENDSILVGLSGGKDSVTLLYLLLELKDKYNLSISAAHFNHKVRGIEANRDEEFSRKLCESLNIDFYCDGYNMDDYAKIHKISKEQAGRQLRKEFFEKILKEKRINKLALAHNKNDQVETVLMRIIRGTGIDGLKGIDYKSKNIIRPLLDIYRTEIEEYIEKNNISYVEDSTNKESIYHRNKIRNEFIPEIKENYNPNIEVAIVNLSKLASDDINYLDQITNSKYELIVKENNNSIELDIKLFEKEDLAIKRRIVRKVFENINEFREDLSFKNVEDIIVLSKNKSGKFIENLNGIRIRNSYDKLVFENLEKINDNNKTLIYTYLNKGINKISDNLFVYLEETNSISKDKNEITIPKELLNKNLVLRTRKNGDKIKPLGLNGTKKLKDIFIDKKIDRQKRDDYFIVSDDLNIYWVYDLVKSELTNTKSKTDEYIKIKFKSMED